MLLFVMLFIGLYGVEVNSFWNVLLFSTSVIVEGGGGVLLLLFSEEAFIVKIIKIN